MTKHTDRLMSRASVAAMAAFAKEPVSTLPAFAERVDAEPPADGGGGRVPIDGLTAEEQAQLDAMRPDDGGAPPEADAGAADPAGDDPGADDDGDDDLDGADGDSTAAGDGAPADGDGTAPPAEGGEPRRTPKTIAYGRHQKMLARAERDKADLQALLDGARQETTKEREARLRLDERSRLLLEAINTRKAPDAAAAAPAADADPEPNADEDPIGHNQWEIRQLRKTVADLQSGRQQEQQRTAAQTEEQEILSTLDQDIGAAIAADPSFADAFAHLRETRFQELGFIFADIDITDPAQCQTLTPQEQRALSDNIKRTFLNEQVMVARQAIQSGRSPAAKIANLARSRGWKPGAAAAAPPAADPPAAKPANGAAAPAPRAPAAPAAGSVKDQLQAVRTNLEASKSLSDGGGSPGGQMTPERLAEMSPREFEMYYDTLKESGKLDELMGRPANY